LELDGRDLRAQSWEARRALLTQLLDRCQEGLRLSEHIADTDGAVVFRQVCVMGLEGIIAKRRDSRYRSGRCREWIKVKNRAHPAEGACFHVAGPRGGDVRCRARNLLRNP
jgi:bifunctional non-homologous end joining protein LigD